MAMAAHLSRAGHRVTLWNRSKSTITKLMETKTITCLGVINDQVEIDLVTDDIEKAIKDPDLILITTPATSHKDIAEQIAKSIKKETLIVLNPGRTFGALEFQTVYKQYNRIYKQTIAETQTIIYTCRKVSDDSVNIISLKSDVLISTFDPGKNKKVILRLPECIQKYFIPAKSMIETSLGNVGMILHCAPLLLNTGWTESKNTVYKYYYDGITPTVGKMIEKIDQERVLVSELLGQKVETAQEWFKRTYHVQGSNLYECIQNNKAYQTIDAPRSLEHRYIYEDVPCGLVPLEALGKILGLEMKNTGVIIDLANSLTDVDFRKEGRNADFLSRRIQAHDLRSLFTRSDSDA